MAHAVWAGCRRAGVERRGRLPGGAESLNAGVAAGVVLYEAARRRA
ncbi:hypothetical protein ABZ654_04135 [Streptomyces hygroscopicus]|nr:hypothetical protein [Streptomyces sp. RKCA744]MCO8308488.1 hypothetical protein [Streptomyces sp. RKCA744]